jgi:hypothetical protein
MLPLLLITMVFILDGVYTIFILPNLIKLSPTPFPLEEYRLNEPRRHEGHEGRRKKIGNFILGREYLSSHS